MEFRCTYGAYKTPGTAYAVRCRAGWYYAVDGSINVNLTPVDLPGMPQPIDVEDLPDIDMFTASEPIGDVEALEWECEQ